jgi:hypothetical protein
MSTRCSRSPRNRHFYVNHANFLYLLCAISSGDFFLVGQIYGVGRDCRVKMIARARACWRRSPAVPITDCILSYVLIILPYRRRVQ